MKIKKRKYSIILFLIMLSVVLRSVSVYAVEEEPVATGPDGAIDEAAAPATFAESTILMDVDTGVILYEKNAHAKQYPASITKLLTCLVAVENSELTDVVTFSYEAVHGIERGSNIGIDEGQQLTMQECYYAILLESANEVAAGVAEHIGGSAEGFAALMNAKTEELGGSDSHFVNANGLPDDEHYTSAYDMALIGQAFFRDEMLTEISGTAFYHIDPTATQPDSIDLRNHHRMLPGCQLSGTHPYEYMIGGKTGYTIAAGHTLVTCAEKNGHKLVCVVLKEKLSNHYLDSIALFDYGFACYEDPTIKAQIDAKAEEIKLAEAEEMKPEEEAAVPDEESKQLMPEELKNKVDNAESSEEAAPEGAGIQGEEESSETESGKFSLASVLTVLVIAVVLAAIAVCGFIFYRSYRREQERRRRQAEIMARHRARKLIESD